MDLDRLANEWLCWLHTNDASPAKLFSLNSVKEVGRLYRRRLSGFEPSEAEWQTARKRVEGELKRVIQSWSYGEGLYPEVNSVREALEAARCGVAAATCEPADQPENIAAAAEYAARAASSAQYDSKEAYEEAWARMSRALIALAEA